MLSYPTHRRSRAEPAEVISNESSHQIGRVVLDNVEDDGHELDVDGAARLLQQHRRKKLEQDSADLVFEVEDISALVCESLQPADAIHLVKKSQMISTRRALRGP